MPDPVIALPAPTPEVIEGVVVPDNREDRFRDLPREMLEGATEYYWDEIPVEFQRVLEIWVREFFTWAVKQAK